MFIELKLPSCVIVKITSTDNVPKGQAIKITEAPAY